MSPVGPVVHPDGGADGTAVPAAPGDAAHPADGEVDPGSRGTVEVHDFPRSSTMRFLFRPPADEAAGLLALPWDQPLEEWQHEQLLEVPQRGISRHVVRFVSSDGHVYALKEIS